MAAAGQGAKPERQAGLSAFGLVALGLAWLGGLALLHHGEQLPGQAAAAALAAGAIVLAGGARVSSRWRLPAAVAAVGLLAHLWAALWAQQRLSQALHPAWEGRDLVLEGRIDSLPLAVQGQGGVPGWRFEFDVTQVGPVAGAALPQVPRHLMLLAYGTPGGLAPAITAGERWRWTVRLKRPHGLANPEGFDAELWLFEQNLRATGLVRPGTGQRLGAAPWWTLDAARQRMREAIYAHVADPALAGVLAALSLGDQAAIGKADWALFRETSVAHLLSVSGMHVTLFAWLASAAIAPLWRRSRRLCLRWPAPLAARWGGVAVALGYAMFSGFGVPAQRTVWMLAAVAALQTLGLRWPWPLTLLAAAVVVTVIDPWALLQAGFWLSFVAVGLLMASGSEPARGWREHLRAALRSQWVATLGLAPLSLVFFQQLSVVGLLANLVAIPLISFVVTPLALLGVLAAPLWSLAAALMQGLLGYLKWLAGGSAAVWWVPVAPAWAQALGLAGAVLMVLPVPGRLRLCGLALVLPMLWPAVAHPPEGEYELLAADIGQGNAVLVRTAGHSLLFDTGPGYAPGADAGERVLLPLLHGLGVGRLDELTLSHRDGDHVGGARSVLGGLPIARLRSSLEPAHPLLRTAVPQQRCEAGQRWVWDGVEFTVLHPLPAHYEAQPPFKSNDLSCVLRVRSRAGVQSLLMGDLEARQEQALVLREPQLASAVLLVPHHGSKTSSSAELLAAVQPQLALVQAGYRSRFGHPAPPVLARYQALGIPVRSSPICGAWRWSSGGPVGQGVCERERWRRYWHDHPVSPQGLVGPPAPDDSVEASDDALWFGL